MCETHKVLLSQQVSIGVVLQCWVLLISERSGAMFLHAGKISPEVDSPCHGADEGGLKDGC